MKVLGDKAELFSKYSKRVLDIDRVTKAALEVRIKELTFLTELVAFFRDGVLGLHMTYRRDL